MMNHRFPDGSSLDRYVGTNITINNVPYQIKEILSERYSRNIAASRAVFNGVRLTDNREVVLVFRVQGNPHQISSVIRPALEYRASQDFEVELRALSGCASIISLPTLLAHARIAQGEIGPYPGGSLFVLVMSRVPGTPLDEIYDLTPEELNTVRHQLIMTLESLRYQVVLHGESYAGQIHYDRHQQQMFLSGFAVCTYNDPDCTYPVAIHAPGVIQCGPRPT